jgi:hypothetical protein
VRMTPRRRYHANTFVFSAIFIFQIFKLLSTVILGWINVLYIEATEKIPLPVRFQRKSSDPCINWAKSRRRNKAFHDTCLGPMRLHLNDTFGGDVSNTLESVSLLCRTIMYSAGYYFWRVALPSHLSSQNLISDPSLMEKDPYGKNNFFVVIRPAQKWESPGFQET